MEGILKAILWVLNLTNRHRRDVRRYLEGGKRSRLLTLLVSFVFVGLTIGAEFLFLWVFHSSESNIGVYLAKNVGAGILSLAVLLAAMDFNACFAFVGIRGAVTGAALGAARKLDAMRMKRCAKEGEIIVESPPMAEEEHKILDLIIGILEILMSAGLLVLYIYLLIKYPMMLSGAK